MPCKKAQAGGSPFGASGAGPYTTEEECLNACKEGACCDLSDPQDPFCYIVPQCVCLQDGNTFLGVGTACVDGQCAAQVCDGAPCGTSGDCEEGCECIYESFLCAEFFLASNGRDEDGNELPYSPCPEGFDGPFGEFCQRNVYFKRVSVENFAAECDECVFGQPGRNDPRYNYSCFQGAPPGCASPSQNPLP